jgi:hypothetical protein
MNQNIFESEMKYQALAIAKSIHTSLAELTFIEMLSVMSPNNPAKKEVQELETKINELTGMIGEFIQKYIPDVADAEVGDTEEVKEVKELNDQDDKDDKKSSSKKVKLKENLNIESFKTFLKEQK